jgi:TolB-like protein/Tfp pilus assembly protein PilF
VALGVITLFFAGAYAGLRHFRSRAAAAHQRVTLAILPVQNLTGDSGREYVSDGLTEEMIAQLGSLSPQELGVIARTSSMVYKKSNRTAAQIGQELAVDYILEGSLRGSGERMRFTAQLIRARDQVHVWAREYELSMANVEGFQDKVATAIARQIHLQLSPIAGEQLKPSRPVVPEAYDAYLKGRFYWNTRTREGLWKSVEQFKRAIEKDPASARAYAGLADSYNMLMFYGYYRGTTGVLHAKAAAEQAIEHDESIAEAHAALAYTNFMWLWDWAGAEREFRRAIELNPSYVPAHHWYALYLAALNRQGEALEQIKFAKSLDPLSPIVNTAVGYIYYFGRRFDNAIDISRAVLADNPDFVVAHAVLGLGYEGKGAYNKAIAEFQRATELTGDSTSVYLGWLGHAYALSGRKREAEEILSELDELAKQGFPRLSHKAVIYAGLGENERAMESLRRARDQDDAALVWLRVDPRYDPLRADPRYEELVPLPNFGNFQPSP